MALQHRIGATLATIEQARKNHREAVIRHRAAVNALENQVAVLAENKAAVKAAEAARVVAEDELMEAEAVAAAQKGEHR